MINASAGVEACRGHVGGIVSPFRLTKGEAMSKQRRIARALERISKTPGPWSIVAETAQDGSLAWAVRHEDGNIPHVAAGAAPPDLPKAFSLDLYAVALGDFQRDTSDITGHRWVNLILRRHDLRVKLLEAVGLKERATRRTEHFPMADRYRWDTKHCRASDGWVQIDTLQDAPYYGTWAHKDKYQIVQYCEGDLSTTTCTDAEAFAAELAEFVRWAKEAGYWEGIDANIRAEEWFDAGFGEYLHRFDREQIEAARAGEQPPEAADPGATVVRAKSSSQLRALLAG